MGRNGQWLDLRCRGLIFIFLDRERERELILSRFPAIQTVILDGAKSKAVLRGKGYAWAPIWWSSGNSKR